MVHFSGYDWKVRTIASERGGMNNLYDGSNAWTVTDGALHLRIQKKQGKWSCAEVVMTRSLGYGTYNVVVRDISHLEPAAVFSTTTFDDWGGDQHYREMDMEISKWGDAERKNNAQYGIQAFSCQECGSIRSSVRHFDAFTALGIGSSQFQNRSRLVD
jgi:hypothetical protein